MDASDDCWPARRATTLTMCAVAASDSIAVVSDHIYLCLAGFQAKMLASGNGSEGRGRRNMRIKPVSVKLNIPYIASC